MKGRVAIKYWVPIAKAIRADLKLHINPAKVVWRWDGDLCVGYLTPTKRVYAYVIDGVDKIRVAWTAAEAHPDPKTDIPTGSPETALESLGIPAGYGDSQEPKKTRQKPKAAQCGVCGKPLRGRAVQMGKCKACRES